MKKAKQMKLIYHKRLCIVPDDKFPDGVWKIKREYHQVKVTPKWLLNFCEDW
jgi:hypothetical protein